MKTVFLTQGRTTLVDDEDFEYLNQYKWYFQWNGYAVRKPVSGIIYMHKIILNPDIGFEVDHINGNSLDNRKSNLRVVTHSQNQKNRKRIGKNNRSGYKGVWWNKQKIKWQAEIWVNNKKIYLGRSNNKEELSKVYDEAAKQYFGKFNRQDHF